MQHSDHIKKHKDTHTFYTTLASLWGIGTVMVLLVIKTYAYAQTNSAAILATLTDSAVDAGISLMMFLALRYAQRPSDADHRHGHGKMEGIASLFQAAILAGGGVFLAFESVRRFTEGSVVHNTATGLWVAVIALVLSMVVIVVQKFCLKKSHSLLIESDSAHYKTDILLNGSVIVAVFWGMKGGPTWVDPACAIFIAFYFGYTAFKIAKAATDMLMDRELPKAVRDRIKDIIARNPDVLGFHDLRTRKSGHILHISFDIEVDATLSLRDAHEITRALEHDILADYPLAEIIIHKDPYGDTHDSRHLHGAGGLH